MTSKKMQTKADSKKERENLGVKDGGREREAVGPGGLHRGEALRDGGRVLAAQAGLKRCHRRLLGSSRQAQRTRLGQRRAISPVP